MKYNIHNKDSLELGLLFRMTEYNIFSVCTFLKS